MTGGGSQSYQKYWTIASQAFTAIAGNSQNAFTVTINGLTQRHTLAVNFQQTFDVGIVLAQPPFVSAVNTLTIVLQNVTVASITPNTQTYIKVIAL